MQTVPELGEFLHRAGGGRSARRCASLAGRRPRLTQQVAALETQQPQTHGAASPSLSKGENVGLFLTLQQEPLAQSVYLAGIHLTVPQGPARGGVLGRGSRNDSSRAPRPVAGAVGPRAGGRDADSPRVGADAVRDPHAGGPLQPGAAWSDQLSLQAYVLTEHERALLVAWLLESLQDADQPTLAEQAMTVLFHFQARS